MQKVWYKSKTILFNALSLILLILPTPEFAAVVPTEYLKFVLLVNLVLRLVTSKSIGLRDK
jgi:hypothetical protein